MKLGKSQREKEPTKVASVAAFNPDGLLLFGLRNDSGLYTLPGGHFEPGEEPIEAARRELEEETGLKGENFEYLGVGEVKDDLHVYCFRCLVVGDPDGGKDPDEECSEWKWVEAHDIPEEVMGNLHSKKNITLRLLGLQDGEVEDPLEKSDLLAKKPIPVQHYSTTPGLKQLDPAFQGTGAAGQERNRSNRIPRTYYYTRPGTPEAHVASAAHLYHGELPVGTRLYDMGNDALGLMAGRWRQTKQGMMYDAPDRDAAERKLKRMGYHGYHSYGTPDALVYFHPLPVRHIVGQGLQKSDSPTVTLPLGKLVVSRSSLLDAYSNVTTRRGSHTPGPVDVWETEQGEHLLVDGHHRLAQHLLSGKHGGSIPARIVGKGYTDYWRTPPPNERAVLDSKLRYGGVEHLTNKLGLQGAKKFGQVLKSEEDLQKTDPHDPYAYMNSIGGTINAHLEGPEQLYVSWFSVPEELRGSGHGRKAWEHFEQHLPPHIKRIRLHAADSGSGSSGPFWSSMGFSYRWDDEEEAGDSIESQQEMLKERTTELHKSFLATAALAGSIAMGGALNAPVAPHVPAQHQTVKPQMHEVAQQTMPAWTPEELHPDLIPIAHLESSFGQNMAHAAHKKGEFHTAFGALGFKPVTAHEEYTKSKFMNQKYPGLSAPETFLEKFKNDPKFYNLLASAHFTRLKHRHGDPQKAAYAWRWGTGACANATDEQIKNDAYVQKYTAMQLHGKQIQKAALDPALGYTLSHSHDPDADMDIYNDVPPGTPDKGSAVTSVAAHHGGREVGEAHFLHSQDGTLYPLWAEVEGKHRNRGVGSEMMRHAEKVTGKKVSQSNDMSPEGAGMWESFQRDLAKSVDSPAFKTWFGDSKVVHPETKQPLRVYHGTTHDFTEFSHKKGNPENALGRGHYFTDTPEDVGANYATAQGPDLRARIEQAVDRAAPGQEARVQRRQEKKLIGPAPRTIPAYLKMSNPVVIHPKGGTQYQLEEEVDENGDYHDKPGSSGQTLINAIDKTAKQYSKHHYSPISTENILGHFAERGMNLSEGVTAHQVDEALREYDPLLDLANRKGENLHNEFIRDVFRNAGHDGAIMDASRFKMKGIGPNTRHYIVWNPTQIKSAIGNVGTYDPKSKDFGKDEWEPEGLAEKIKPHLTDDLRRKPWKGSENCLAGHCYVASEAMYHLLGGAASGYVPQSIQHEGGPHWYLKHKETGEILDPTAGQFKTPVPYEKGVGKGFLTKQPSKRAQVVIDSVKMRKSEELAKGEFRSAGFRHKDGTVVETGTFHNIEPWMQGGSMSHRDDGPHNSSDWEAGFVTNGGVFMNRDQAAKHVNLQRYSPVTGQLRNLDSQDPEAFGKDEIQKSDEAPQSHDYHPEQDYEMDEAPSPEIQGHVRAIAPKLHAAAKDLRLGVPQIHYVKGLADSGHLAKYIDGTSSAPVFVVDAESHLDQAKASGVHPHDALFGTLFHELGHAYLDSAGLSTGDDREEALVERFAHHAWKTGDHRQALSILTGRLKKSEHDPLEALLAHENPRERILALKNKHVTPYHLRVALQDEDPEVRAFAARHPKMTAPMIHEALHHEDIFTRKAALSRPDLTPEHLQSVLFDPQLQTLAALHPRCTEEQRAMVADHHLTPPGLKDELLAKTVGYLMYPRLGQNKVPSTPMIREPEQYQEMALAHAKASGQRPDLNIAVSHGYNRYNMRQRTETPGPRREFSLAVKAGPGLVGALGHETQHGIFSHLKQTYGKEAGYRIVATTLTALDPDEHEHLKKLTDWSVNKYKSIQHPEERIAHLQNYLQDHMWRAKAHKSMKILGNRKAERESHDMAKRIWQKLKIRAQNLTPQEVGVILKTETERLTEWADLRKGEVQVEQILKSDTIVDSEGYEDQLGMQPKFEAFLKAAKFLAHAEPDYGLFRRALLSGLDLDAAVLTSVGLPVDNKNKRALLAVVSLQDHKPKKALAKAEGAMAGREVQALMPDGVEVADAVRRGFAAETDQDLHLGGKHSKGTMMVRDPETGMMYLLKPGSGHQSPAKGAQEEGANQSRREAAYWHVADMLGLGMRVPRADLLLIDGQEVAALHLLPFSWKNLEKLKFEDPGLPHKALEKYRHTGELHKWAVMDYVLGNTDRHGQNLMVGPEKDGHPIALIDHGSAFAGPSFDPARDENSFIPYYLRAWKGDSWHSLLPEQRLRAMPSLNEDSDDQLRSWLEGVHAGDVEAVLARYGIDPQPSLDRLVRVRKLLAEPSVSQAINRLWLE